MKFLIPLFTLIFQTALFSDIEEQPIANYGPCRSMLSKPTELVVTDSEIEVNGRVSHVYDILYNGNERIIEKTKGDCFNLVVKNQSRNPTSIHWHGLVLPYREDGTPYVTQPPIPPGKTYAYNFELVQAGTYWAHSHYGLQEQKLLGLPLILNASKENAIRSIVLFFEGFTFKSIDDVWQGLRKSYTEKIRVDKNFSPKFINSQMPITNQTLNDVQYDAFLTNRKTVEKPDLIIVKPGEIIRLRLINGSASSNFHIDLGDLKAKVIAVDGNEVIPIEENHFPIATAQRVDVLISIPQEGGLFPIFAQCQGRELRGGALLMTKDAQVSHFSSKAASKVGAISNEFDKKLHAKNPLPNRKITRSLNVTLDGNMEYYTWGMNNHAWPKNEPLYVLEGQRVEVVFKNNTPMAHPMHLHGHIFQVTEIGGEKLKNGPLRDTLLVMPYQSAKIEFDANNPGIWAFHCHNAYHLWGGMFTVIKYENFEGEVFSDQEILKYSQKYN